MRVFFGLNLDDASALSIAAWRDRQVHCDGRPVSPADFHLTLAFVGELDVQAVEALTETVDRRLDFPGGSEWRLTLNRTGYWQKAGIYWLGPERWVPAVDHLAGRLRDIAVGAGARRERKAFRPHLTLYRRCALPPPVPVHVPQFELRFDHFTLFESRQAKRGTTYHPLCDWSLPPE